LSSATRKKIELETFKKKKKKSVKLGTVLLKKEMNSGGEGAEAVVMMTFICAKEKLSFFYDHKRHVNERQQYKAIATDKLIGLGKQHKLTPGATVVFSVTQQPPFSSLVFEVKSVVKADSNRASSFASKANNDLHAWRAETLEKIEYLMARYQAQGMSEFELVQVYPIVYQCSLFEDSKCFGSEVFGIDGVLKGLKSIHRVAVEGDSVNTSPEVEGSESDGSDEGNSPKLKSLIYQDKRWGGVKYKLTEQRYEELKGTNVTFGKRGNNFYHLIQATGRQLKLPPICWGHRVYNLKTEDQISAHLVMAKNFDRASGYPVIVGLDTEWLPEFGLTHSKTAILQLAFSTHCFIIQLLHLSRMPRVLAEILADPTIYKIGHEVHHDATRLQQDYGLHVAGLIELRDLEIEYGCPRKSLAGAYEHVFRIPMPKDKRVTLSNWERYHLTEQQIAYAALDAIASRSILFEFFLQFGQHRKSIPILPLSPPASPLSASLSPSFPNSPVPTRSLSLATPSAEFGIGWNFQTWIETFC